MNIEYSEIECERVLAPSRIDIGDYVINPYRGCMLGCRYCYVRKNKAIQRRMQSWGSYVDCKVNAPAVLEKELKRKRPKRVLLGSTTEVYQPCESRYHITREILTVLNNNNVACTILTRSPLILNDLALLSKNSDPEIYFTITPFDDVMVQNIFEPHSSSNEKRFDAILQLTQAGIRVRAYMNPLIPHLFSLPDLFKQINGLTTYLDFEALNITMVSSSEIMALLQAKICKERFGLVKHVCIHAAEWKDYWEDVETQIEDYNKSYQYNVRFFSHPYSNYFNNVYKN